MLIKKEHALKTGVMAAALLGITFVACKKDKDNTPPPPRTASYKVFGDPKSGDAAKQVGVVVIEENRDKTFKLTLSLDKTLKDITHKVYIIDGDTSAPKLDTMYKKDLLGTGSKVDFTIVQNENKFTYDSAVSRKAFVKILKAQGSDSVMARGNVLKSFKP